ncbi:hypothetical protein ISCGN_002179 [Ixodes scapularis]
MEFDAQSGRTLAPPGPRQNILRERHNLKNPPANPTRPSEPRQSTNRPPGTPAPRLPDAEYKVVFRPRTALRVAAYNDRQLTQSLQQASKIPEHISYAQVTVQIQASQNLIVAGTPEENCALALSEISTIQLRAATHEILPYLKSLSGTKRGMIHGLDPGTTTDLLPHILAYNSARILHARMLGNSTSAVVTFEGIHVPFYIKAYVLFARCRPYRQTVQCCSLCGELGHRQNVFPNPDTTMCAQCHTKNSTPDHDCTPKCQLCGLTHPTASLRIAAKRCDHRLRHCESGNELSPHGGGNNNRPQIPSLISNDNSHRTSRTNNRSVSQPSSLPRLLLKTNSSYSPPVPPKLPTPAS